MEVLIIYLLFINGLAIAATSLDKYNAMHKKRRQRVPEKTLLLLALLGGCFGMYATMLIIRHKTQKPKFMILLPIIIMLEAAGLYLLYIKEVF